MIDLIEFIMKKETVERFFTEITVSDEFKIVRSPPEGTPKEWLDLFEFREING